MRVELNEEAWAAVFIVALAAIVFAICGVPQQPVDRHCEPIAIEQPGVKVS